MSSRNRCNSGSKPRLYLDELAGSSCHRSRKGTSDHGRKSCGNGQTEGMSDRRRNCGCSQVSSGSCSRYCANVCRTLFPLNYTQCFNDCTSCQ
ncbi:hypothetical protein [Metabacillus sp. FJAT-52054]|uniref:TNFR-Cys domain-containing protein n=1 Tax=Metabacillus sediminis TaxID=3117746 RepID=A0ABZ2NM92_9BACI